MTTARWPWCTSRFSSAMAVCRPSRAGAPGAERLGPGVSPGVRAVAGGSGPPPAAGRAGTGARGLSWSAPRATNRRSRADFRVCLVTFSPVALDSSCHSWEATSLTWPSVYPARLAISKFLYPCQACCRMVRCKSFRCRPVAVYTRESASSNAARAAIHVRSSLPLL